MADQDAVWKALADPTRRRLLDLLKDGPRRTGELSDRFPTSRFAVMKHLAILERAGLILVTREGRERWNHLNAVPIRQIYEQWISGFADRWAAVLLSVKRKAEAEEAIEGRGRSR
ncbi:MAG: ArsR/SmtB family transcription factor [Anaerolineales bacterium]